MTYEEAVAHLLESLEKVRAEGETLAPRLQRKPKGKPVSDTMMSGFDLARARASDALLEVYKAALRAEK